MTARLTNAIGTRLGLTHSWKSKMIINTKSQFKNLFKREQTYNLTINTLFRRHAFKKQSILRGEYSRYYNHKQKVMLDVLVYDTGYDRIRRDIKHIRKYTSFKLRQRGRYYKARNIKLLKRNQKRNRGLKVSPLVTEIARNLPKFWIPPRWRKNQALPLRKGNRIFTRFKKYLKSTRLVKKIIQRTKRAATVLQKQVTLTVNRIKRTYQKLTLYFLGRHKSFIKHARRLRKRLVRRNITTDSQIKVNLIALPKVYLTTKLLLTFIIKRLYLKYSFMESFRNFKKFFKLRTLGYTIRACGKLSKKQRAWYVKKHKGKTKINNLLYYVNYAHAAAALRYGKAGIKLWINY